MEQNSDRTIWTIGLLIFFVALVSVGRNNITQILHLGMDQTSSLVGQSLDNLPRKI